MNYVEAETGAHVIVRGIWQNNKILVLYNGHKITSPEGKDFIFGRHNWSLANVKRVEFIYGPASALYGADAVSAVINIVPKDWKDLDGPRRRGHRRLWPVQHGRGRPGHRASGSTS